MINILQTKSKFALYIIVIFTVAAIIIGCAYKKYESQRIIVIDKRTIQEEKQITQTNHIIVETETDKEVDTNQVVKPVSLGNFKLTAYCSCSLCCGKWAYNRPVDENGNEIVYGSIGERLKEGYSIAVDPSVIAYNSKVIINDKVYEAQDCGGAIKGNRIDVYFSSHEDALNHGVKYAEVFLLPEVNK